MLHPPLTALVADPRRGSRTALAAAELTRLLGRHLDLHPPGLIDLATLGPAVLDPDHAGASGAVAAIRAARVLVVAAPVHDGTCPEILRTFLRRIEPEGLRGVSAVALPVTTSWLDSPSVDTVILPLLSELGADCPAPSLFLHEHDIAYGRNPNGSLRRWVAHHGGRLQPRAIAESGR